MSDSLRPHGLYSPWNSPDQNTGVGRLSLLQEIIPTQGPNLGQILYQLSHRRSPRILEWVAYSFLQWIFQTQELNCGTGIGYPFQYSWASPCGSAGKESTLGSTLGLRRSQYSGLENSTDHTVQVHWVTKSWTRLSDFHFHFQGIQVLG